jgi:hypothetical protein
MPRPRGYLSIWSGGSPTAFVGNTTGQYVGLYVSSDIPGRVAALKFYRQSGLVGNHFGMFCQDGVTAQQRWTAFRNVPSGSTRPAGWELAPLHPWFHIAAGVVHIILIGCDRGSWKQMIDAFTPAAATVRGHFTMRAGTPTVPNGGFQTAWFPRLASSLSNALPAVDMLFLPDDQQYWSTTRQ